MNSTPAEIGARIKAARKAAKLNQTELANQLNKTLRTVQKYESGEIEPSIAMLNEIAKVLGVSPAELIGYQKKEIRLDTLSDVLFVLNELNKKAGLRFEIEVQRPPQHEEWTCALKFDGKNSEAAHNADLCLFLERYAEERRQVETYWTDQDYFDHWFEKELAYYAETALPDREVEILSHEERLERRNALDRQMIEAQKKAAEENGDQ
jgi:transcriptional regulator with XRE-family HTH domain